ncbi:protein BRASSINOSTEROID INSENSITIVE 1 [Selaginella moellendorffii]|uniref:protein BRASSINOSTEROID INSENSITIVE 1 n=1 Tax=Selaginella moellendorffii TaxID=88036 RepID=UPI000D1C5DD2|nr:protein BRASSINOSTEROID INSENSITIVE 1 [Selaginella moellendorffii]|eukprot:XP_024535501.1 protein BRASSINOSTEROID INSENSITIVE 1 [Selaginella moellendorffii]
MSSSTVIVFLISFFIFSFSNAREDSSVLLSFKNSVEDPSKTLSSWNISDNFCQHWNGVACTTKGRVSVLELEHLTLPGSLLVSTINALPFLLELSVLGSNFTDAMNSSEHACSLEMIKLSSNQNMTFTSSFDAMLGCQGLKVLNLSNNQIDGKIEVPIGNALEVLDVSHNLFSGEVPLFLSSQCKRLRYLDLSHNHLTGELPVDLLKNCTNLQQISLAYNSFHGTSFPSIHSLPSLEFLDASFNNFTGPVPAIHENLKHLNLSSNSFNTTRENLCPSLNSSRLESLILVNNKLTGRVLDSVLNCSSLKMLDLSFNLLAGEIPSTICKQVPKLEHFLAWVNNLEGQLPPNLASCSNLTKIILTFNNLSGNIPPELLSNTKSLQWLSLSNNRLSGEFPDSLEHAKEMLVLQLSNNSLQGKLPSNMTVQTINLRGNSLSGRIPASLNGFQGSKLAKPNVAGTSLKIASGIKTCGCMDSIFMLQGISLEEMESRLTAKSGGCKCSISFLPASFYGFSASSPSFIDVSFNKLVGGIPRELGSMQDASYISLAHNFLSGTIPVELGDLKNIIGMDLSFNGLQGSIPGSFSSLQSLTGLNVSHNNLSGPIPQGGQLATLDASSYAGNAGLCGFPLASCITSPPTATNRADHGYGGFGAVLAVSFAIGVVVSVICCTMVVTIDSKKRFVERACYG